MSAGPLSGQQRKTEALNRAMDCVMNAIRRLDEVEHPQWKRIQNSSLCFKGLPIDHLPKTLEHRLEATFCRINAVLARYPIKTWEDYQTISLDDLKKIEVLLRSLI